jgi:hypothetical protein
MPPLSWANDPMELIRAFETRYHNPNAGALFAWAAWAVDGLHYLADIDATHTSNEAGSGHRPDVVDVAHARWATGTCITAVDLCAAGLGRAFCGHGKARELDLADFDLGVPTKRQNALRGRLPLQARSWVDGVCADPGYREIKEARDWLTHSRILRHFRLAAGGPPQRLELQLGAMRLSVRQLIERARDAGNQHVVQFLAMLPHL